LDVLVTGGRAPYLINGISSATGVLRLTGISAGYVDIEVIDSDSCSRMFSFDLYVGSSVMTSDTGIVGEICSGSVFDYMPMASVANTYIRWSREAIPGIVEPYASSTGPISEKLTMADGWTIPILVTYQYILEGPGACFIPDTVNVEVWVNPATVLNLIIEVPETTPGSGKITLGNPIRIYDDRNPSPYYEQPAIRSYTFTDGVGTRTQPGNEYLVYMFDQGIVNEVTVVAINEFGCESRGIGTFNVSYELPNMILPNEFTNNRLLKDYDIQVFNRNGSELYRGTTGWDGTYKGTLVASGTYYYVVHFTQPNGRIVTIKHYVFVKY